MLGAHHIATSRGRRRSGPCYRLVLFGGGCPIARKLPPLGGGLAATQRRNLPPIWVTATQLGSLRRRAAHEAAISCVPRPARRGGKCGINSTEWVHKTATSRRFTHKTATSPTGVRGIQPGLWPLPPAHTVPPRQRKTPASPEYQGCEGFSLSGDGGI